MENPWPTMIGRQFAAAIQMLRLAVEACPEELWDDRTEGSPFWHLAYHALFFADLYLSKDERAPAVHSMNLDHQPDLPGTPRQVAHTAFPNAVDPLGPDPAATTRGEGPRASLPHLDRQL